LARKHFIIYANSKPPARDSWLGNLENRSADLPALADERFIHLNPFGGEILAKLAVFKRSADLLLPPPCVFDGVCVDHFVGSAMCLAVCLIVAGKVHTSDRDPTDGRRFPDSTSGGATAVFELAHATDVD
jgi:hypothetical protein